MFQSAPLTEAVSIRSPYRSKGRCELMLQFSGTLKFQSAPLTEARGDSQFPEFTPANFNVSIRSPYRSKGRYGMDLLEPWIW